MNRVALLNAQQETIKTKIINASHAPIPVSAVTIVQTSALLAILLGHHLGLSKRQDNASLHAQMAHIQTSTHVNVNFVLEIVSVVSHRTYVNHAKLDSTIMHHLHRQLYIHKVSHSVSKSAQPHQLPLTLQLLLHAKSAQTHVIHVRVQLKHAHLVKRVSTFTAQNVFQNVQVATSLMNKTIVTEPMSLSCHSSL